MRTVEDRRCFALRQFIVPMWPDGSLSDVAVPNCDVRYTPQSRHFSASQRVSAVANNGHGAHFANHPMSANFRYATHTAWCCRIGSVRSRKRIGASTTRADRELFRRTRSVPEFLNNLTARY